MKLCLGTVQFGMDYGIQGGQRPAQELVDEMLSCALDQGIYRFDTASAYGKAETVLGQYKKSNPDRGSKMQIVSKLASEAFDGKDERLWADLARKQAEESLEKLKTSELEAYLFHNAAYLFHDKAIQALCSVKEKHLAKKIGVSIYTPKEAMKALEYNEIKAIQIPYNVFDQRLDQCGFFEKARKSDVEVYARSSMLQGLMLMEPESLPENMHFAENYLRDFRSLCREYQVSPLKAAVGYVGAHPGIDYVVFGVDNKRQLTEYLGMQKEALPESIIRDLREKFEAVEEKLVNPGLW